MVPAEGPKARRLLFPALIVLAGIGLRLLALSGKYTLDHDEAISLLAAGCNQGEWERVTTAGLYPFGAWAPAEAWQSFLEPSRSWCFATIGADLAEHDIHPPLYFWLLHPAVLALGVHLWTGSVLNLAIYALGAAALFAFARRALRDDRLALVVLAAWSVSPAVVRVFADARQYELFAALTAAFALLVLRLEQERRARDLALLGLVTAAGALTHYHFAIVAAAGALWLAVSLGRRDRRWLAYALGAMLIGYAVFAALHPEFLESFGQQQEQAEAFTAARLADRLELTARAVAAFVVPDELLEDRPALTWAVFALLAAGAAWALRRPPRQARVALWSLLATAGATVALYLGFVSHGLAMGGKYLAAAWPFAAFLPALAVQRLSLPRRVPVAATLCGVLLAGGTVGAVLLYRGPERPPDPAPVLAGRHVAVVDTVRRGVLPAVLWHFGPRERVLAADQGWLLANERRWRPSVRPPALFVSDERYGDRAAQRRLVALLGRALEVRDTGLTVWGAGRLFELDR